MHSEGRITAVAVVTLMTSTRLTSVILRHLGSHILVEETPEGVVTVAEGILVAATKSWQDERLRNYNYQIVIECLDCVM